MRIGIKTVLGLLCAIAVLAAFPSRSTAQSATDYAGTFNGDRMSAEILAAGDGTYTGTLHLGSNQFPLKAHIENGQLVGTFSSAGKEFPFTLQLSAATFTFTSGGTSYTLNRVAPDTTPGKPPTPADGGGGDSAALGSFRVLGSTASGKTLYMKLPGGMALEAAIIQTADELGKVLDGKPALPQAFATAQNRNKGGASLTGKFQGHDVKGVMFCSAEASGGSAVVIFAAADAPKDEVATLFSYMPVPLKMMTHSFPDGSGSVDLPDGWTTPTTSASNGIVVQGPAGQVVLWCTLRQIWDPNCLNERMRRQIYQQQVGLYKNALRNYNWMVQNHNQNPNTMVPSNPPQPPAPFEPDANVNAIQTKSPLLYCRYCDGAAEVLRVWYPLLSDLGKRMGVPYTQLDKTIFVVPGAADPNHPNVKAGTAYIAVSDHNGDSVKHFRVMLGFWTNNVVPGETWLLMMTAMRAPDETFDKDLPVMTAIMGSIKVDEGVVNKEFAATAEATREWGREQFEQMERNHQIWQDEQAREFADHEQQIAEQEQARHDSSSDFIEYIRGVRDVYDTKTGKMISVDLFYSNAITDELNAGANDPNRFVQIPLRYER